jgi:hypothetical protein
MKEYKVKKKSNILASFKKRIRLFADKRDEIHRLKKVECVRFKIIPDSRIENISIIKGET